MEVKDKIEKDGKMLAGAPSNTQHLPKNGAQK